MQRFKISFTISFFKTDGSIATLRTQLRKGQTYLMPCQGAPGLCMGTVSMRTDVSRLPHSGQVPIRKPSHCAFIPLVSLSGAAPGLARGQYGAGGAGH